MYRATCTYDCPIGHDCKHGICVEREKSPEPGKMNECSGKIYLNTTLTTFTTKL